jgi:hypothetical protein
MHAPGRAAGAPPQAPRSPPAAAKREGGREKAVFGRQCLGRVVRWACASEEEDGREESTITSYVCMHVCVYVYDSARPAASAVV